MLEKIVHGILQSPVTLVCMVVELFMGIRDVLGKDRIWLTGKYYDPAYRAAWQRRDGIFELAMAALFGSYLLPDENKAANIASTVISAVCLVVMVVHLLTYISWTHRNDEQ